MIAHFESVLYQWGRSEKTQKRGSKKDLQLATLGGGCFWCVEAVFERLDGVESVTSGYAGGSFPDPSYKQVSSGTTGHAEVIQIAYNPDEIAFEKLLGVFWMAHDPTTLNRQGADIGTQYRSIILFHDEAQQMSAEASKLQATSMFGDPIVTEIVPLEKFYPAEKDHQGYYRSNPEVPYCQVVIKRKLDKLAMMG